VKLAEIISHESEMWLYLQTYSAGGWIWISHLRRVLGSECDAYCDRQKYVSSHPIDRAEVYFDVAKNAAGLTDGRTAVSVRPSLVCECVKTDYLTMVSRKSIENLGCRKRYDASCANSIPEQ
jgi:hypothetical protein